MRVANLLAAAGAILALSAGAALAAQAVECCTEMAANADMSCCDKMKSDQAPAEPVQPAPTAAPSDAPALQGPADPH